jgi:hypothetical protein
MPKIQTAPLPNRRLPIDDLTVAFQAYPAVRLVFSPLLGKGEIRLDGRIACERLTDKKEGLRTGGYKQKIKKAGVLFSPEISNAGFFFRSQIL